MWRIHRKIIFPRWCTNRQANADNKNENTVPKALILCQANENKNYSNGNNKKKQHADKKDKRCWDDPQFHCYFLHSYLLETAGWLGAAGALCLKVHLKLITNGFENDRPISCPFSRNALAMPGHSSSKGNILINLPSSPSSSILIPPAVNDSGEDKLSDDVNVLESIRNLTDQYVAAVDNSVGIASLDKNNRKAFRHFQAAARLGSSQAFYNLGLCYELGKGTRINFCRAAFCYRRAAIKGHGLAAFNLAVYFMKGIGGLPVDPGIAKLLLAEAAKKGVPEAQLYQGIELLENEKWVDAFAVFDTLAKGNIPEGQYYLGLCYENGWGSEKNAKVALELFKKAADQGNEKAASKVKQLSENDKKIVQSIKDSKPGLFSLALYHMLKSGNNKMHENHQFVCLASTKNSDLKQSPSKSSNKSHLHVSASVPELSSSIKVSAGLSMKVSTPLYLNLMIPLVTMSNHCDSKPSFFIGDKTSKEGCSNHLLPCSVNNGSKIMEVKI